MQSLRQSFIAIFCLILCHTVCSQSAGFIQLKGLVLEEKTEEVVPFATLRIKGAALGTITDLRGSFSFWVSERYGRGSIVFSSVGYLSKEMPVAELKWGELNRIILKPDTVNLGQVTVVRDKKLKPLEVLKRAIARIPANNRDQTALFDAYYRERVLENGAIIKYADAAVTFEQTAYDGRKYKQQLGWGPEWKSSERYGSWLASYGGLGRARDRMHDHFGHKTAKGDRVKIHQVRASLNNTREALQANIEGGPLGTLSKDLVKYLAHFMDAKNFKDYLFELMEIPAEEEEWDYLVKFKPKQAPRPLEEILASTGRTSRMDILSGEIYIDKTSFAIKKMNYRVGQKHRRHICNLQRMSIKHYGYQVDVNYEQYQGKWQMRQIKRVDEFIFKDTITSKSTPYAAISEIFVNGSNLDMESIPGADNFKNLNHNSLQSLEAAYHPQFWREYEERVPVANWKRELADELGELNLEDQFLKMKARNKDLVPSAVPGQTVTGEREGKLPETMEAVLKSESAFWDNYFGPLEKVQQDLMIEFASAERYASNPDSTEAVAYEQWTDFKKANKGHLYQVWERKAGEAKGKKTDITVIFMGKDKDRWLKERPVLVSLTSEKPGLKMKFDPALMPLLNRGMILAYVHVKGLKEEKTAKQINWKNKLRSVNELIVATKYLKENALAHPRMIFVQGSGMAGGMVASAIDQEPGLFAGALFTRARFDAEGSGGSKAQAYPHMAFFTGNNGEARLETLAVVSRLRQLREDQNVLLLNTDLVDKEDKRNLDTYRYALLFQWIDEAAAVNKK